MEARKYVHRVFNLLQKSTKIISLSKRPKFYVAYLPTIDIKILCAEASPRHL